MLLKLNTNRKILNMGKQHFYKKDDQGKLFCYFKLKTNYSAENAANKKVV